MRVPGIAVLVVALSAASARGGGCPDCPPPALSDADAAPTVKQAIAVTKKLLKAIRTKKPQSMYALLAVPLLYDISGRPLPDMGCYDGTSYVDEGEDMPGRPECLATALAKAAKKLEGQNKKKNVYASLAALESKRGALRSPSRGELENLTNHRFVYLAKGAWKVVIAVRSADQIDAVIIEPPKGWTPPERELTQEPVDPGLPEALDSTAIKTAIGGVKNAVLQCGDQVPDIHGTVKLTVKVAADGKVTEVTVAETPDAGLGTCAASVMKRAAFAKTQKGGSFKYPFVF